MRIARAGQGSLLLPLLLLATSPARGQSTLTDSAKTLVALAESSYARTSDEGYRQAIDYWEGAVSLYRQLRDPAGEAALQRLIGNCFSSIGLYDSSMVHHRRALELWTAIGNRSEVARALLNLGAGFSAQGEQDSALAYARRGLALVRELGLRSWEGAVLANLCDRFHAVDQSDSALVYCREALAASRAKGDQQSEAYTLVTIGLIYANQGLQESALSYFRQALSLQRATGNRRHEGWTLLNIGVAFSDLGLLDSALAYENSAREVLHRLGDHSGLALVLVNLGFNYQQLGRLDSARTLLLDALRNAEEGGDRPRQSMALENLGWVTFQLGDPDSAVTYLRLAMDLQRAIGDRRFEALSLDDLGVIYLKVGKKDSAIGVFRNALALRRAINDRGGEAKTLGNLGLAYSLIGASDSALSHYRQALGMLREVGDRLGEATALRRFGRLYQGQSPSDWRRAVAYYDSASVLQSAARRRTGQDPNRLSFAEQAGDLFDDWTLAWLGASEEVGPRAAGLASLAASERGRSQVLLDLMRDTSQGPGPGADLSAEGARLLVPVMRGRATGLSYLATPDTLITWVVTSLGEVSVVRMPIARDALATRIAEWRAALNVDAAGTALATRGAELESAAVLRGHPAGGARAESGASLAAVLLPPEVLAQLAGAKEVIVVPQGPLALVPFTALPIGPGGEPLGARVAVRYAPSLATLGHAEARPGLAMGAARASVLRRALVVGNPRMPEVATASGERGSLEALPGAEAESRAIATRLAARPLIGGDASEGAIRLRLSAAPVVHLATHGFAYSTEANARNSFVALAPDSGNDGRLTVGEILDDPALKLNADLVVLSACQTGLGDLKQAEGTVGLQRAFLAKGARSVLVSLWNVSDAATRKLMTGFYRHWLSDQDHPDKAESLRRAQEEVRKTPGWEHPRFWAGFQLVGAR